MDTKSPVLTFSVTQYVEHNHDFTRITIQDRRVANVQEVLEGTIGNRAGYGTDAAAAKVGQNMRDLLARGVTHYYEHAYSTRINLKIESQHYGSDCFCAPRLCVGESLSQVQKNLAFLKRLGRSIERARARSFGRSNASDVRDATFETPNDVIAALERMRGTKRVETFGGVEDIARFNLAGWERWDVYTIDAGVIDRSRARGSARGSRRRRGTAPVVLARARRRCCLYRSGSDGR